MLKYTFLPLLLVSLASTPTLAQETLENRTVYSPADFVQYGALNARDMVERIPGFRLSDTGEEARGFGQATENVLINGQRPSSKSASAAEVLERIPADTVEKIEILDGASVDIPGLSGLVVNVIAKSKGTSGTWTYRLGYRHKIKTFLDSGELAISGQKGDLAWSASLDSNPRGSHFAGTEEVFDGNGELIEFREIDRKGLIPDRNAGAGIRWTPSSGIIANANVEYEATKRDAFEVSDEFPVSGIFQQREIDRKSRSKTLEFNGDVEFDAGPGRLKFIGVYSDRDRPFTNSLLLRDEAGQLFEERFFSQDTKESETIGRAEYKWSGMDGAWEASLEGARNTLESSSFLLEGNGTSDPILIDIGDTFVEVEEIRGEGFLTYSRDLSNDLQVQLSLGAEVSELTSKGANGNSRTFQRPKGGITMRWQADENTAVNARINRQVGQLDFFDFVSQLDLDNGDNQTGNANIVPEQSWSGEVEIEQQFGPWGAANFRVFGEALEDIVDQIPIGSGEGPGNIDSGSRYGVELDGTLNFDPLGIEGAQLNFSVLVQDSSIEDPLTFQKRSINNEELLEIELELRHDIKGTDLAWGGEISPEREADRFRLTTIQSESSDPPSMSIFLEHKDLWGLTGRFQVFRPFTDTDRQTRLTFSPDRTGSLVETERRQVKGRQILTFQISGKF